MGRLKRRMLKLAAAGALAGVRQVVNRIRQYDLQGKNVVITGGSRGLGLVLARQFAEHGANVAICARDAEEVHRACQELGSQFDVRIIGVTCDVTNRMQVAQMAKTVREQLGSIDVLVNNAGVIEVGPMEEMTLEDYEEAMRTHFWAPLFTTLAVLPDMKAKKEGRIVNISSIGGKLPAPHLLPYTASKFALTGFSEGLRVEVAQHGIAVTTVCPGLMRTGSPRNAWFKGQHRAEYAWFSISDSLPLLSMAAERAARQIITACRRGEAEVVLSVPAKLAVTLHGLFPGLMTNVLSLANRFLPGPGGIGKERARGFESTSAASPSVLTTLNERAAERNNEVLDKASETPRPPAGRRDGRSSGASAAAGPFVTRTGTLIR